jgi:hypothetical protein
MNFTRSDITPVLAQGIARSSFDREDADLQTGAGSGEKNCHPSTRSELLPVWPV